MSKLLIFLLFMPIIVHGQEKLVKTKISDEITVSLPKNFYAMSQSDMAQRYPSVRKPVGAYTNDARMVDFSVNISATQWRESDVEIAKEFFKASLVNLYDRVNFIQEDIKVINNRKFIVFEFESRIEGDRLSLDKKEPIRKYTYIQYLIMNGKTLVFSFNSPVQLKGQWQPVVPEIMNSVKVKNGI
ncbi:hypothetical protein C900_00723 [Fulvivirga imtechensis AK7]|uniref:DUF1795 domain-containing protein n=1 Tax=Fulvivirga imtechensis AK7 TaxID=1237149 RepID=L8JL64_9BACT|nr:hypothetical protein [Fulvivirga imtechensis]ELR68147.1 hypothetical protein C900_00723 [Fulvivirga imtechensis AK7]